MKKRIFSVLFLFSLVLFTSCYRGGKTERVIHSTVINDTDCEISIFETSEKCQTPLPLKLAAGQSAALDHSYCEGMWFKLECGGTTYSGNTGYIQDCRSYRLRFFFDGEVLKSETSYRSLGKNMVFSYPLEKIDSAL